MRNVAALVPPNTEVVNAHDWPALHAGRLASKRLRCPLVWTRNDGADLEYVLFYNDTNQPRPLTVPQRVRGLVGGLLELWDARKADAIVVLDRWSAGRVGRAYHRKAAIVRSGPADHFHHPPDREEARRRLGIPPSVFVVLAVGILFPHRRFEDVVDSIALLEDTPDVLGLLLATDWIDKAYGDFVAARIGALDVGQRVRLERAGFSESQLRDAYAAADLFVFPNENQTWGLAPLEALAGGTPVVLSSGAGVHEVLANRPGVTIVRPREPVALATAISYWATRPTVDIDLTRKWIEKELAGGRYAERMIEVFQSVLQTRPITNKPGD